jgi:hypothetical protein
MPAAAVEDLHWAGRRAGRRVSCGGPRASIILAWVRLAAALQVRRWWQMPRWRLGEAGVPGQAPGRGPQAGRGPGSGRIFGEVRSQVPCLAEVQSHGATRQLTLPPKSPKPG